MESLETAAGLEDLLDFASDIGEEDDDDDKPKAPPSSFSIHSDPDDPSRPLPDCAEEELEWLSNKDAFPAVETFVDILSVNPGAAPKQRSPVSVLENSNSNSTSTSNSTNSSTIVSTCHSLPVPVRRARSKRRRKRRRGFPDIQSQQLWWCIQAKNTKEAMKTLATTTITTIGRKCQHCQAEKTPQWRAGPMGPKTLCNACGVRYKSGRLVPEYRPASSPTFSMKLHSNSHRKIMEMRKLKQGNGAVKPMDKG
ncbi:hypothetical protein L1049_016617 [Liquidambar formosana]|uniref:GATA-type domain-containing protein n=1 Tax=Liquidambar formosana TaxID=63359 RepID=A0AAP0RZM4_LIQFO